MGNATQRDLHVDQNLSQIAIDYRPQGMIADMLAPIVPVAKESDRYAEFSRAEAYRNEDTLRSRSTPANRVIRSVSSGTYYAQNYALSYGVPIEDRANADPIFVQKLFNGAATYLTGKLLLDWEVRVATQVTNTSNVGSSSAVTSGWTDTANSDPLGDINAMMDNFEDANGIRPNRVTFGGPAWRNARRNSTILNRIFGNNNGGGYASTADIANLLDVQQILIGGAYQNTADRGQSEALASVWGDNVLLSYSPFAPSMDEPSFMYSFRWNAPGLPSMVAERHPYDSKNKEELVEVGYYQDEKITGASYGWLLTAVNSST